MRQGLMSVTDDQFSFSHLISCFLMSNMRSMGFTVSSSLTRLRRVTIRCIILPSYYAGIFCSQNRNYKSSSLNNIRCTPRMTVVVKSVQQRPQWIMRTKQGKDSYLYPYPCTPFRAKSASGIINTHIKHPHCKKSSAHLPY